MICCSTHSSNLMVPTFFTVSNRNLLTLCTMKRISKNQSNEILSRNQNQQINCDNFSG